MESEEEVVASSKRQGNLGKITRNKASMSSLPTYKENMKRIESSKDINNLILSSKKTYSTSFFHKTSAFRKEKAETLNSKKESKKYDYIPGKRGIRPGFDVTKMWKKAREVLKTVSNLRRIKQEIETFGMAHKPIGNASLQDSLQPVIVKEQSSRKWYLIYPDSRIKTVWNVILTIILGYTAVIMPTRVAFSEYDSIVFDILDLAVDILFWIDMGINFVSAYTDINEEIVDDFLKILYHYLTGWFFIDLIACFPFDSVFESYKLAMAGEYNELLRFMRLPRLYRLVKLGKLAGAIKMMTGGGMLEYGDLFIYNASFVRLIVFVIMMLLFAHWFACFWYLSAKTMNSPESWIFRRGIQNKSVFVKYLHSFYWSITTMYTIGYGDISAYTIIEKAVAILWMFLGAGMYTLMIGALAQLMSGVDSKQSSMWSKISTINEFCREANISSNLRLKMKREIYIKADRENFQELNNLGVFEEMNPQLKWKVITEMHNKVIMTTLKFLNLPTQLG